MARFLGAMQFIVMGFTDPVVTRGGCRLRFGPEVVINRKIRFPLRFSFSKNTRNMKIAISGSTGLIGTALVEHLRAEGHTMILLGRADFALGVSHIATKIEGCPAIINLAGAPILKRWTSVHKKLILKSRTGTTSMLSDAIALTSQKPSVFLSASAVGIYKAGAVSSEARAVIGHDFLAEVCRSWELATATAEPFTRVVHLRFGVVLSPGGGALATMLPIFRLGLGGSTGSGKQPFPWIHMSDLTGVVGFLLSHREVSGPVNVVAPGLINNATFADALGKALRSPSFLAVPAFILRLLYGEGASALLQAAVVVPEKLTSQGYVFQYPDIYPALQNLVAPKKRKASE